MAINPIDQSLLDSLGLNRTQQSTSKDSLGQSDFLKLMTTQLNNQDPMKPMEGGEFFSQISQFSSVAGIQELQNTFQKVADVMFSGQALQASSLVGRNVMVEGDSVKFSGLDPVEGAVDLASSVDGLKLDVYSLSGELLRSIEMGPQSKGNIPFSWDGNTSDGEAAQPGQYILKAEARYGRETYGQTTWVKEKIDSVTLGDGLQGIKLNMANNSEISLGQVKKIL